VKIALFTETFLPKVDGIVTRLTKTIEFLIKNGDEVIIFCPEGCPESYMGATVVGVAAMPLPLYPELKLGLPGPAVSDKLEKFNPDLIHVVNPAVLGLGGIWLAKTNNIPLIASYHTHLPKYLEHYGMGMLEPLLWELLKAAHNQALLNLCTSTAMVNELKDKTNLSKEEVAYEYQSSSLAVISSLYEGFGFPAAEAMACGTPIISSNSSALPEIVQDFGQLYEPGNSDALKDCIENFYLNRSAFNDLAKKGSLYANETFNWQKIALDYEEQFLETIEKFNSC